MTETDDDEYLFCWKVHGTHYEYTGYYAEEEAKAVAKQIGGSCFAFPLYVRPQPADEPVLYQHKSPIENIRGEILGYSEWKNGLPALPGWPERSLYTRPQPAQEPLSVDDLELENRMLRARNERLEKLIANMEDDYK